MQVNEPLKEECLAELFKQVDTIGGKYQSEEERKAFREQMAAIAEGFLANASSHLSNPLISE